MNNILHICLFSAVFVDLTSFMYFSLKILSGIRVHVCTSTEGFVFIAVGLFTAPWQ